MNSIKKVRAISYYTFKEIMKSKILVNVLILGIALVAVTFVAFSFTYGEASRVALDFGLGTLSLSSVAIAIFIGVGLLSDEIESRTVYMIISRPVHRASFIIGKLLGLSGVLVINIILLSFLTLSCYFFIGGEYSPIILWSIIFTIVEAIMMLLVVCLLSLKTSKTLSVIFSILLYISGHAISETIELISKNSKGALSIILEFYHYILPGFYKLNIKEFVIYKQNLSFDYLVGTSLYAVSYSMFLLCLIVLTFNKKNLD